MCVYSAASHPGLTRYTSQLHYRIMLARLVCVCVCVPLHVAAALQDNVSTATVCVCVCVCVCVYSAASHPGLTRYTSQLHYRIMLARLVCVCVCVPLHVTAALQDNVSTATVCVCVCS